MRLRSQPRWSAEETKKTSLQNQTYIVTNVRRRRRLHILLDVNDMRVKLQVIMK